MVFLMDASVLPTALTAFSAKCQELVLELNHWKMAIYRCEIAHYFLTTYNHVQDTIKVFQFLTGTKQ